MHSKIRFVALGLLFTAWMGCGDNQNTNKSTSGTGAGGSTESGGAGGTSSSSIGGMGGMASTSSSGMGGMGGMGGGCIASYEDCTTPADENCDGQAPSCSGDGLWAKTFGDADFGDQGWVASDAGGNVFVGSNLLGYTIDFGGPTLTGLRPDVTLAKLGPDGSHLWSKRYGGDGEQVLFSMREDGSNGVVLAGYFSNAIDFGNGPLTTPMFERHPFVARIDATGKEVFSKSFSGSTSYEAHAIAAGSDGGTVIGGCGQSAADFGVGAPPQTAWSAFVVRLSPTGQTIWAKTFTSTGTYVCVDGVALDKSGNVAITGLFEGTVNLGDTPATAVASYDAFVMAFDTTGKQLFRRTAGGTAAQAGTDVDFDPAGDIVVMGTYQDTIDWGPGPHTTAASTSTFLTKFDLAGNTKWSKAFAGPSEVVGSFLRVDPVGHLLLTGSFFNAVDFGNGSVTSNGFNDLFVTKLDANGQLIWNKTAGDGDIQAGGTIAYDNAGHVFLGARILGAVDMGTGSVPSHGKDDTLVAKLAP